MIKIRANVRTALLVVAYVVILAPAAWAVANLASSASARTTPHSLKVADVAGWTRHATTEHYLLIISVGPSEQMYTAEEIAAQHPISGEAIITGTGVPVGEDIRHVEVHIYGLATGELLETEEPTITVVNRSTGEASKVDPVLMEDIEIGKLDRHFGNNTHIPGNSDLSLEVSVNGEKVTVDGHLD